MGITDDKKFVGDLPSNVLASTPKLLTDSTISSVDGVLPSSPLINDQVYRDGS